MQGHSMIRMCIRS